MAGIDPLIDADGRIKALQASRDFDANELVLVPLTDDIQFREQDDASKSGVLTSMVVNDPRGKQTTKLVCAHAMGTQRFDMF
jgi:hypothetical protein